MRLHWSCSEFSAHSCMLRTAFTLLVMIVLSMGTANGSPVAMAKTHRNARTAVPSKNPKAAQQGIAARPAPRLHERKPVLKDTEAGAALCAGRRASSRRWRKPPRCMENGWQCRRRWWGPLRPWPAKTTRPKTTAWSASRTKTIWPTASLARCWFRCRPLRRSPSMATCRKTIATAVPGPRAF